MQRGTGGRGVRKALFSLASALRGAFFPSFLFAGVRARSFKANYEGMLLHRCRRRYFAGVRARHSNIANSAVPLSTAASRRRVRGARCLC